MTGTSGALFDHNLDRLNKILFENSVPLDIFPLEWLKKTDYLTSPASTKYHAAYPGGLFDHSVNVAYSLLGLTRAHTTEPWSNPYSPIIIGLLHDTTKIGSYSRNPFWSTAEWDVSSFYVKDPEYISFGVHGLDSVIKLQKVMELSQEEAACIRFHMGAYETESWGAFDQAIRVYPNVLWTHTADMVASKLLEVHHNEET